VFPHDRPRAKKLLPPDLVERRAGVLQHVNLSKTISACATTSPTTLT
jgi:hypothetical protein